MSILITHLLQQLTFIEPFTDSCALAAKLTCFIKAEYAITSKYWPKYKILYVSRSVISTDVSRWCCPPCCKDIQALEHC